MFKYLFYLYMTINILNSMLLWLNKIDIFDMFLKTKSEKKIIYLLVIFLLVLFILGYLWRNKSLILAIMLVFVLINFIYDFKIKKKLKKNLE